MGPGTLGSLASGALQRLHPISPVLDLVMAARQAVLPLVLVVVGSGNLIVSAAILLTLIVAYVGWRYLAWSRFTYRIDNDVLTLQHGVLNRNRREVPIRRIQQVGLQRKLRHRVLGVAVVRVDTAGGSGGAEVELEAVSDEAAMDLRTFLLTRAGRSVASAGDTLDAAETRHGSAPQVAGETTPVASHAEAAPARGTDLEVVSELTIRDLVIAGVTGSRLGAALPIVGLGLGLFFELPESIAASVSDQLGDAAGNGLALAAGAVLVLPFVLVAAAVTSVFTDHGFLLVRIGGDLHLRRGLLDQRESTLSLHRIQVVRVFDNPVRRRLGAVAMQIQSAGSGSTAEGDVTRLTIPYVPLDQLDRVLGLVLPGSVPRPALRVAPVAARRRLWFRRLVPVVALIIGLLIYLAAVGAWTAWVFLLFLLLVPAGLIAEQAYRGLGHATSPGFVLARRGGLFRETVVVPVAKTQSSRLVESPFQRRLDLATLYLDVAGTGRTPAILDAERDRLDGLRHAALYTSAARADEGDVRRRARGEAVASAEAAAIGVE